MLVVGGERDSEQQENAALAANVPGAGAQQDATACALGDISLLEVDSHCWLPVCVTGELLLRGHVVGVLQHSAASCHAWAHAQLPLQPVLTVPHAMAACRVQNGCLLGARAALLLSCAAQIDTALPASWPAALCRALPVMHWCLVQLKLPASPT